MSTRGIKFNYEPGECVLCFEPDPTKARVIYEAKILDTTVYRDEEGKRRPGYHIHFLRWNNSWDRIVGEQLVLKNTDGNRSLMKQLSDVARKNIKNKTRKKMIHGILAEAFSGKNPFENDLELEGESATDTNDTDESNTETESIESDPKVEESKRAQKSSVCIDVDIPDALKSVLDKDYFAINQDKKFVKLPAEINVVTVLESFVKTFMMEFWSPHYDRSHFCHNAPKIAIDRILPMCKEFVDGVRICFDFMLPTLLLYDSEGDQHNKIMNTYLHKSPDKQKVPADDSPLLKSPRSKSSFPLSAGSDEPCPKLPKYSPSAEDDDEVSFNPKSPCLTPRRVTRNTADANSKLETDKQTEKSTAIADIKDDKEKLEQVARQIRRRRCSDRQDDGLRRRALRSYRKSSEDSDSSDKSKPDTIMSEPVKQAAQKSDREERPPPLLIPCNLVSNSRPQNGAEKPVEKGAPESTDSAGDSGKEILANILQWKLLPPDAVSQLPTPPALLYGAHHLLRLFVKLPEQLSQMDIDEARMGVLKKLIQQLLLYLSEHVADLFPDNSYVTAS